MKHAIENPKKFTNHILFVALIILLIAFTIISAIKNKNKKVLFNTDEMEIQSIESNYSQSSDDALVVVFSENESSESQSIQPFTDNMLSSSSENKKNNNENNNQTSTYYIKVNNQCNVVTIYGKNSNGEYTVPKKAMVCSIGTSTPESGVYSISDKYVWRKLVGDVYGQYATRITGSILFHSVPYEKQDKSTLEWWEYDLLGQKASKGCVRLTVEDAKWIYDNCAKGTQVEFYSSSNPGPLGKPTAQKISSYDGVRVWDPTDPDTNNPWLTYNASQSSSKSEQETTASIETQSSKTEGNISDVVNVTYESINSSKIEMNNYTE